MKSANLFINSESALYLFFFYSFDLNSLRQIYTVVENCSSSDMNNSTIPKADKPPNISNNQLLLYRAQHPPAYQRLVVLVPNEAISEAALAQQIGLLAAKSQLVALVAVVDDAFQLPHIQLRLTFISQLLISSTIQVSTHILQQSWPQAIRHFYRPGDLVMCLNTHEISIGHSPQLMHLFVANVLRIPTYVVPIETLPMLPAHKQAPRWLSNLLIMGIIVGGTWALAQTERLTQQWSYLAHAAALSMVAVVLFVFIAGWHFYID